MPNLLCPLSLSSSGCWGQVVVRGPQAEAAFDPGCDLFSLDFIIEGSDQSYFQVASVPGCADLPGDAGQFAPVQHTYYGASLSSRLD